MFTHRHLIVHLICASSLLAMNANAQQIREARSGQLIPGSAANQRQNSSETNEQARNAAVQQDAENIRVVPGKNRVRPNENEKTVASEDKPEKAKDKAKDKAKETPKERVVPGQNRTRTADTDTRRAVASEDKREKTKDAKDATKERVVPGQNRTRTVDNVKAVFHGDKREKVKDTPKVRVVPAQEARNNQAAVRETRVVPGQDLNRSSREVTRDSREITRDNREVSREIRDTRVLPGQDRNRIEMSRESRVLPGQDRNRVDSSIIIPSMVNQRSARLLPGTQERVIPGSGMVGSTRPIVTARQLPPTVVINRGSSPFPYVALTPFVISKKGDVIELNDGSVWDVRNRQRRTVRKWSQGDTILIETGRFYTWSTFQLVNYTRGESVDVELSDLPNWNGRSSHWIIEVNPYYGYVRLEDGSIWRMSTNELAQWQLNDDVIVGLSRDWFSNQYNYVLINPRVKSRFIASFEFQL